MDNNLETELINYNKFREVTLKFLDNNPLIEKIEFKKYVNILYSKCCCTFELKDYFYSNLYNEWILLTNLILNYL